jgi:Aminopeptidase N
MCQLDHFLIEDLHPVMILDASLASHSIVQMVGHPDEITELFDTISYSKVCFCCTAVISVNTQIYV